MAQAGNIIELAPTEAVERALLRRQRILARIDAPSVRKIIIMWWWESGDITEDQAEALIRLGGLEAE